MNHYITVYSNVFAVMLNVMVFISYERGAFKVPSGRGILRLVVSLVIVVLVPVLFFAGALTVIEKTTANMPLDWWDLLWVLYWVTPVYGFQQLWLLTAWMSCWPDFGKNVPPLERTWWLVAFAGFGLNPVWQLIKAL